MPKYEIKKWSAATDTHQHRHQTAILLWDSANLVFFRKTSRGGFSASFWWVSGGLLHHWQTTGYVCYFLISTFIHYFKGIRNLKIPNLLAPVNWLISDVNLTFPYWCGAFYASAPYILYIHITYVVQYIQHSAKTINKGGRIHCLKSLKSLHEMLYI